MNKLTVLFPFMLIATPAVALAATPGGGAPNVATAGPGLKSGKAGGYQPPVPSFAKVDTNGDHEIEWKEAKAVGVPKAVFKRYDYHHDGKLTLTEWRLVKLAMIHTARLPVPGPKSLPSVPSTVSKKMNAPAYGKVVTGKASAPAPTTRAPAPSTKGRGQA